MQIHFSKYQGTGNDFVLIDNRTGEYSGLVQKDIALLCDRKFGIGADGLMLLNSHPELAFEMIYYNADGNTSTMCGNGGRCILAFARDIEAVTEMELSFMAVDGVHPAKLSDDLIELKMIDVDQINQFGEAYELFTGSPHYIQFVEDIHQLDVYSTGRAIRYNDTYKAEGINVNFVSVLEKDYLAVATYERGVEDETLSCGTGVTAAALAYAQREQLDDSIRIETKGGKLQINFERQDNGFTNVWLCGPAQKVFEGSIQL